MRKNISLFLVVTFLLALVGIGCNGGSASPITISLEPNQAQVIDQGQTLSITAIVAHDPSNQGVTWSLSGEGSLTNQTANRVDYGAPSSVSAQSTATVTATSVANTKVSVHLSITIMPSPSVSISPDVLPKGTVGVPYAIRLLAAGGVEPYTWSISAGSLPSWASFDSDTGAIRGTPDASGTSNFAVQVTDSGLPSANSATQELSIAIAAVDSTNNAELKGQYAFRLQGFDDATGNQFAIVGSFMAGGDGMITSGLEDINGPGGYKEGVAITGGAYNVGADNRGFATLTNSLGTTTFAIAVGSLDSSKVATRASLIEFDDTDGTTGKRGSGIAYLQDTSAFNLSSISGPYAFQFAGQTEEVGTRLALTGSYTADGKGNMTNGNVDSNIDGLVVEDQSFTATVSASSDTASFGRVAVTPTGVPFHFVSYIVSASHALAMSTEPESTTGLLAGEVLAQATTSFSAASLNGTAVGYGVGKSIVSAGFWTFNGSASASYRLDYCYWFFCEGVETGSLSYAVDPNTGKVTTAGATAVIGVPGVPIFYLVDNNKGFLMSTDGAVTTGLFEAQTGAPFSNASLSGNYFFGSVPPGTPAPAMVSGVGTSTGDGTLNLTGDQSEHAFILLNNGWTAELSVTVNADGKVTNNDPWLPDMIVAYMISDKKAVAILNTSTWPAVAIFDQ